MWDVIAHSDAAALAGAGRAAYLCWPREYAIGRAKIATESSKQARSAASVTIRRNRPITCP